MNRFLYTQYTIASQWAVLWLACNQLQGRSFQLGPILYYIKLLETKDTISCSTSLYKVTQPKWTARTEHIMWEEEDNDVWLIEADDSWFPDFVIGLEKEVSEEKAITSLNTVEAILNDILNKVCEMS